MAEIAGLCEREFLQGGTVTVLSLSAVGLRELANEALAGADGPPAFFDTDGKPLAEPPARSCGMRVSHAVNPSTKTLIAVGLSDGADTMTVTDADGQPRTVALAAA